ncbi:hypothetical protein J2046_006664 [Rhizobium petrolearium]|nr:hypothetical protein [Neorhizobium petrolearium]
MKLAYPIEISNLREIIGHVRPMALANAIHARVPSSWGGAFFITLLNLSRCCPRLSEIAVPDFPKSVSATY